MLNVLENYMMGFVESAKIIKPYCLIFEKFIVVWNCKNSKIEVEKFKIWDIKIKMLQIIDATHYQTKIKSLYLHINTNIMIMVNTILKWLHNACWKGEI